MILSAPCRDLTQLRPTLLPRFLHRPRQSPAIIRFITTSPHPAIPRSPTSCLLSPSAVAELLRRLCTARLVYPVCPRPLSPYPACQFRFRSRSSRACPPHWPGIYSRLFRGDLCTDSLATGNSSSRTSRPTALLTRSHRRVPGPVEEEEEAVVAALAQRYRDQTPLLSTWLIIALTFELSPSPAMEGQERR